MVDVSGSQPSSDDAERDQAGVLRAGEDAAGLEVQRAGKPPSDGHGREQEQHRGQQEKRQVRTPAPSRLLVAVVRHERIGHQRERLVEQVQRQQVPGERDAHREPRAQGDALAEQEFRRYLDLAGRTYEDFLTGFVVDAKSVWGRPVGVAALKDGSLLVSDDGSGSIWRVSAAK